MAWIDTFKSKVDAFSRRFRKSEEDYLSSRAPARLPMISAEHHYTTLEREANHLSSLSATLEEIAVKHRDDIPTRAALTRATVTEAYKSKDATAASIALAFGHAIDAEKAYNRMAKSSIVYAKENVRSSTTRALTAVVEATQNSPNANMARQALQGHASVRERFDTKVIQREISKLNSFSRVSGFEEKLRESRDRVYASRRKHHDFDAQSPQHDPRAALSAKIKADQISQGMVDYSKATAATASTDVKLNRVEDDGVTFKRFSTTSSLAEDDYWKRHLVPNRGPGTTMQTSEAEVSTKTTRLRM